MVLQMAPEKRNFTVRFGDEEKGTFSGSHPRQAAMKAARKFTRPASDKESARDNSEVLKLREKGTKKVHVYEAWSWERHKDDDEPDWLGEKVTEANVSKEGIEKVADV